jgi:uncharacterized protein (DUF885 family)
MADVTPAPVPTRDQTPVDQLAERYLAARAELDPMLATYIGLPGRDEELPDLSPDGLAALAALDDATLAEVHGLPIIDDTDKVTVAALIERIGVTSDVHALGADLSDLNVIASPLQGLRGIFDLMPTATSAQWSTIAHRMHATGAAMHGYITSLRLSASRGDVPAQRQVTACIAQCDKNLGPTGFFATLAGRAGADGAELPDAVRRDLDRGVDAAQAAYLALREFLSQELLAQSPSTDSVGIDKYQVFSRMFLGASVDLAETYEWGQAELARIGSLMRATAQVIRPGASVPEAIAHLDTDPARRLSGTEALRAWMQETSDAALSALTDTQFDIPAPLRRLDCRIAPTQTGVIYYTGPSDDFSRPGQMWWSVPEGVEEFSTWRERTIVYHEGVPGHHLQVAQAVYRRSLLNSWRRFGAFTSGHAEGWALYAEWLMAELGFMDDPGDRLGLLDGQSLRSARVVLDIGVHCGFPAPAEVGGGDWDYDKAWAYLTAHANMAQEFLRFELDRYLGWPGQAPSYKLGERIWLQLREDRRALDGAGFDLKAFHREALDIGGVGLDVLTAAVLHEL